MLSSAQPPPQVEGGFVLGIDGEGAGKRLLRPCAITGARVRTGEIHPRSRPVGIETGELFAGRDGPRGFARGERGLSDLAQDREITGLQRVRTLERRERRNRFPRACRTKPRWNHVWA